MEQQQGYPPQQAADRAGPASWELDLRTGQLLCDAARRHLFGVDADAAQSHADWWDARVHPDDIGTLRRTRAHHFHGAGYGYRAEYRARHQDGRWLWLLEAGNVVERDADDVALRATGMLLDITAERETQRRDRQQLEQLRAVFDHTCQFSGLLTPAGILVETNDTSLQAAQVKRADVLGRLLWETAFWCGQPPGHIVLLRAAIERAAHGEPARFEQQLTTATGPLRHVDVMLRPVCDPTGHVTWILIEGRDVTDIMTAQRHLQTLQERLTIAAESAHLGLWDLDLRGGSLWCNDTWWVMLGYQPGELPVDARSWQNLVHPDDLAQVHETLQQRLPDGASGDINMEFRMRCKDGSWRWIHSCGRAIEQDDGGAPRRIAGVHIDVTGRREAAQRLATAERLESVGKLAAGVAHEINTPIQFVSDSVYFIRDGVGELLRLAPALHALLPADTQHATQAAQLMQDLPYLVEHLPQALERALEGLDRVTEIVRSMREFAHPDQARMALIDINRAIQSTLVVARNEYRYVAEVDTRLAPLPPVRCHAGEINQVLLNLIVNAAHAIADTHCGPDNRGRIQITTQLDGDSVLISITDTGTGIAESIRHRIFEPFFTTKAVGRGTGQGLSIAHAIIVRRHGGSISFQTAVGQGTTFNLRLPLDCRQLDRQQLDAQPERAA